MYTNRHASQLDVPRPRTALTAHCTTARRALVLVPAVAWHHSGPPSLALHLGPGPGPAQLKANVIVRAHQSVGNSSAAPSATMLSTPASPRTCPRPAHWHWHLPRASIGRWRDCCSNETTASGASSGSVRAPRVTGLRAAARTDFVQVPCGAAPPGVRLGHSRSFAVCASRPHGGGPTCSAERFYNVVDLLSTDVAARDLSASAGMLASATVVL